MLKKLFFFIFFLFSGQGLFATHIVGGEIRYESLGFNMSTNKADYRVTLKVYRDCYNGLPWFDSPAVLGIYSSGGMLVTTVNMTPMSNDTLPIVLNDPCVLDPNGLCVHVAKYEAIVTLPFSVSGYYFVYQRCCRNEIINNILKPAATGATYYVFMSDYAQISSNSSPDWSDYPPVTICYGKPISQPHSATDVENDQIVYNFCAPLSGADSLAPMPNPPFPPPYLPVEFDTSYTAVFPMGGTPAITIDSVTGLISGTPDQLGNFVIGVCGREYRNGFLMSEFGRDFQYVVSSCSQSTIMVSLENAVCDTTVDHIDLSVTNGVSPYHYNWSTGATTEDLPLATPGTTYTVTVSDAAGCTSALTINGNDCVWPGDANYDGVANNDDILSIGLFYGDNGPVRPNATNDWAAQPAPFWNAYQFSGVNSKHVDCDGSGSVNSIDVNAVSVNYNKDHPTAFKVESGIIPLLIEFDDAAPAPGQVVNAYIGLGLSWLPATDAYGISFSIYCDHPEIMDQAYQAIANFSTSAFGDENHTVHIFKAFPQEGRFDFAICNTTRKSFAYLYGEVARFQFQMAGLTSGVTAHFTFADVHLIDDQGNDIPVIPDGNQIATGLFDLPAAAKNIRVMPNPATDAATLQFEQSLGAGVQIDFLDMTGRVVMTKNVDNSAGLREITLATSGLSKGLYLVQARDGNTVYAGKLIVEQ